MYRVIFLFFFGEWVLKLFGPEFVEGHGIMIWLALAQLSHAAVGPVTRLLAISGHHKHSLYASGASLVLWLLLTSRKLRLMKLAQVQTLQWMHHSHP